MEIVSYVMAGALEHKDSMGNGEQLRPGEFQRITAGTGITHSEFNPSVEEEAHFYQIWLLPERKGLVPGYEQKSFDAAARMNRVQLVASPDGRDGSLKIHQDVQIFLSDLEAGANVRYDFDGGRHGWLQVLRGRVKVGDIELSASDGLAISNEPELQIVAKENAEIILFDLS